MTGMSGRAMTEGTTVDVRVKMELRMVSSVGSYVRETSPRFFSEPCAASSRIDEKSVEISVHCEKAQTET